MTEQIKGSHCHLWTKKSLLKNDLKDSLEVVEIIEQESHNSKKIMKCKDCGQLYLYHFVEEVDWEEGNDDQCFQWIPVRSVEEARELCKKHIFYLLALPSIRIDFTKNMKEPKGPYKSKYSKT